ncbi:MAG: hypothetical protein JWL59_4054 [Chthoniobacteraceae bacterium]|nr:hypothetical protein [Chthoniobacteraceae bacterium]
MDTIESAKSATSNYNVELEKLRDRTELYVREEPMKAVGIALGTGVILTVFPVFKILGGVLRLFFSLVKPALLCFGAIKISEEISKRSGR